MSVGVGVKLGSGYGLGGMVGNGVGGWGVCVIAVGNGGTVFAARCVGLGVAVAVLVALAPAVGSKLLPVGMQPTAPKIKNKVIKNCALVIMVKFPQFAKV